MRYRKNLNNKKVYDLANLWYQFTGLPFVFALWIVRKEITKPDNELYGVYVKFRDRLIYARHRWIEYTQEMIKNYYLKNFMTEEEILFYWKENMDYNLTEKHKESLKLFENYINSLA